MAYLAADAADGCPSRDSRSVGEVGGPAMPPGEISTSPKSADSGAPPPATVEVRAIGRRDPVGEGWLIRDVSLAVHPGERLAIIGTTGAGKTVLLRALALLDPLHAGSIHWRDRAVQGDAVP